MGKILSFLPVDGLNNLFHICLGESVISIGWLLLFWNFLFNSHSCSGTVVLQLPRNFVDFFFFQKAVLSWPLVMGAFPIWLVSGLEKVVPAWQLSLGLCRLLESESQESRFWPFFWSHLEWDETRENGWDTNCCKTIPHQQGLASGSWIEINRFAVSRLRGTGQTKRQQSHLSEFFTLASSGGDLANIRLIMRHLLAFWDALKIR